MDSKLQDILVCPQCKGSLISSGGGLICKACELKFPVRDGIPVMLVDEAVDLKSSKIHTAAATVAFRIIAGPNKGLAFHLDKLTCKAIGRAMSDPNKTARFNVDISLSLDEGTKGVIQQYVRRQFKELGNSEKGGAVTGSFKRTSDVILDDIAISRLHAMIFYGETGIGILDLVSKNGTFVNGEEIESRPLKKGDTIEIGETKIVFEG